MTEAVDIARHFPDRDAAFRYLYLAHRQAVRDGIIPPAKSDLPSEPELHALLRKYSLAELLERYPKDKVIAVDNCVVS